jgi:hypothetical protein
VRFQSAKGHDGWVQDSSANYVFGAFGNAAENAMERMDRKRVSEGAEGWGETGGWMLEKACSFVWGRNLPKNGHDVMMLIFFRNRLGF